MNSKLLTSLLGSILVSGLMLTACDTPPANTSNPEASASASTEASASAETPNVSASVDVNVDVGASADPQASASAEPNNDGKPVTVSGESLFAPYYPEFKVGLKWEYVISASGITTTIAQEVAEKQGEKFLLKNTSVVSTPFGDQKQETEVLVDPANPDKGVTTGSEEATVVFTKGATGVSVTVPAGSYTADIIKAKVTSNSTTSDNTYYLVKGVGMVKVETVGTVNGITVSTNMELTSFSN